MEKGIIVIKVEQVLFSSFAGAHTQLNRELEASRKRRPGTFFNTSILILLTFVVVAASCLLPCGNSEAAGGRKVVVGSISNFDCEQDICLLTVVDAKGVEHDGLCSDPRYDKWNKDGSMPDSFKGKKVKVTVEESSGGHGRGSSDNFVKIEALD